MTVTLEQQPPKSVFKTSGKGSEEIISTGTATYYCSAGSGSAATCVSETGPNPPAGATVMTSP